MLKSICESKDKKPQSPLDQAEKAIKDGDYPALAEAAGYLAKQVPDNRYLVEPLLIVAEQLAQKPEFASQAIDAAKVAACYALSGSDLEKKAISTWVKHVEALPDAAQRIDAAAEVLALYAQPGSDLAKQADAKLEALQKNSSVPSVPTQRAAQKFVKTFTQG